MTKILIVVDNLGPGGTQRQIIEYLNGADRNNFEIKIINLDRDYDALAEEIKALGYEVIGIAHKGRFSKSTITQLQRLFIKEKPNIVHTYLFTSDFYGRLAAKLAGVPVIVSAVRNVDLWQRWQHKLADWLFAKFTDKITINAECIRPFLVNNKGIPADKIVTIYNGIDLKRFEHLREPYGVRKELGIPSEALVVGMVSRFSKQKDYATFFKSAAMVLEQIPNVYFVAVGDGPKRKELELSAISHQISAKMIFTGLRKDIPDLINAMDISILSSHYEGCPNVILEYMACSKPVIASDVGGCSELIVNNRTGFIVSPGNPAVIVDKLLELLKDKEARIRIGKEGRKRIEEYFTSEIMVKNTESLYKELLKPKIAFVLSQFPETHETFILREFRALQDRGINFKILSLKSCRDKVVHQEAEKLVKQTEYGLAHSSWVIAHSLIHPIKTLQTLGYVLGSYWRNPKELIKALYVWLECFYFARVIKKEKISHIHSHWATMPTTAAVILSRLTGLPYSFTAHAWDIFVNSNGLVGKINEAKFVVTCTDYNRRYLLNFINGHKNTKTQGHPCNSKIYRNYHGINLDEFRALQISSVPVFQLKILAIGRLVETKGFEYLIEACSILNNRGIDFVCYIVGTGPLEKRFKLSAIHLQLLDKVKFLGIKTQEEIKRLYGEATVLTQPSVIAKDGDRDGIPNVIIEAMAMGVPIVATNVSGIPEVVVDGETGILVSERDSLALANGIEQLWRSQQLREALASRGRVLTEHKFNIDKNAEELIDVFQGNGVFY